MKDTFHSNLVGAKVIPKFPQHWRHVASLDGKLWGTIRGVWLDKDKEPVCLVQGPDGDLHQYYVAWLKVEEG